LKKCDNLREFFEELREEKVEVVYLCFLIKMYN